MTVRRLLKEIIDEASSLDQEVILFAECCDDYKPAEQKSTLNITTNGDCLQLFMRF